MPFLSGTVAPKPLGVADFTNTAQMVMLVTRPVWWPVSVSSSGFSQFTRYIFSQ